jgi:pimeloyl-ACP methyl ester carboxylesterase
VRFSLYVPRAVRAALALIVLLALAGATYQGVRTSLERRHYPHPGRLVDVGGHQLQIYCTGRGTPIVVLEAPAAGLSASWTPVQTELARVTRVCSYDRAGLGWSERGDGPFDPERVPLELQALLEGAGERPPYVVAGAGMGAAYARAFAARFPELVSAAVLLDPPAPGRPSRDRVTLGRMPAAMPWLARFGLLRAAGTSRRAGLDPAVRAFLNRPDHLTRAAFELARWDEVVDLADDAALASGGVRVETAMLPGSLGEPRSVEAAVTVIRQAVNGARRTRPTIPPGSSAAP